LDVERFGFIAASHIKSLDVKTLHEPSANRVRQRSLPGTDSPSAQARKWPKNGVLWATVLVEWQPRLDEAGREDTITK
jgi:hypothetical protein